MYKIIGSTNVFKSCEPNFFSKFFKAGGYGSVPYIEKGLNDRDYFLKFSNRDKGSRFIKKFNIDSHYLIFTWNSFRLRNEFVWIN